MLRRNKRTRAGSSPINVYTPGARALAHSQKSVRAYFPTTKRARFGSAAAAVAGVAAGVEAVRRAVTRGTQTTNPKVKTKTKETQKSAPKSMYGLNSLYSGRFRRPRTKPNITRGIVFRREDAFTVEDSDGTAEPGAHTSPIGAVYTGVTAIVNNDFQINVLLAILRVLCRAKGFEFNSPDDLIKDTTNTLTGSNVGSFHYLYRQNGNNSPVDRSFSIGAEWTWWDLASNWFFDMNADTIMQKTGTFLFDKIFIYGKTNDASNVTVIAPLMSLNMRGLKISYNASHTLYIQNRTKDSGGDDNVETVDSNPIKGKLYVINTNSLQLGLMGQNPGVSVGTPNAQSGRFQIEPQLWTKDGAMQQLMARPPSKAAFRRCSAVRNITLQPGEIKKGSVNMTGKDYFDKIFTKFFSPIFAEGGTNEWAAHAGKSIIFGFEKCVRTSAVDSATAYACRLQLGCTNRQYLTVEAHPMRKQPFIAKNITQHIPTIL
jgi:hypothetical protein